MPSHTDFGRYIKELRLSKGLSLRDVEGETGVSNAYLSLLENGLRKNPHPDILRKLAQVYAVPTMDLMRRAGYLEAADERISEVAELDRAYQHATTDPDFEIGTRITGPVSDEVKRYIVKAYEMATRKSLLKEG